MRIIVSFDDEMLLRYDRRGASMSFTIFVAHEGTSYPEEGWIDFGAVILGYWIVTLCELANGKPGQDFVFMDGPFAFYTRMIPGTEFVELKPRGEKFVWVIPFDELAREVIRAGMEVFGKLKQLGVGLQDMKSLAIGIRSLDNILVERSEKKRSGNFH